MSSHADAQSETSTDVGARLRAARNAKQMSLREIAATTKISVSALEALEDNDTAALPGGIFTRAFVRSYAAEVGLDAEQTMRDFMAQVPVEGSHEDTAHETRSPEHDLFKSQQRMAGTVLKLLLVGLPVAILLAVFGTRDVPSQSSAPEESVTVADQSSVPSTRVERPVSNTTTAPAEPNPEGPLTIELRPRGECWVSLTVDGESIFTRVMRAGERETFDAVDEIVLNVGDAGAFAFAINQQNGRSLGASGEVVTARITHQNYGSFVDP
jgi:transcriptional regulator with XRE-family HTH domain